MPESHSDTAAHPTPFGSLGTRWIGVGLATVICIVTLWLCVSGRIALYINPDSAWFAAGMAVLGVIGAVATCILPLGAEADHGHDHGTPAAPRRREAALPVPPVLVEAGMPKTRAELRARAAARPTAPQQHSGPDHAAHDHDHDHDHAHTSGRRALPLVTAAVGGVTASAVVLAALLIPPASLSSELAMSRDLGVAPLFGGDDVVTLTTSGDLDTFGIGEWANMFQNTPDPRSIEGTDVTLVGFLAPTGDENVARLTRMVITHCVIDAQPAGVPLVVPAWQTDYSTGTWVEVSGKIGADDTGALVIQPTSVTAIPEPAEPYEY